MRTSTWLLLAAGIAACNKPCPPCEAKNEGNDPAAVTAESLRGQAEKLNYAVAYDMGQSLARNELDFKQDIFLRGLLDGMKAQENPEAALMDAKARMETKREHSVRMRDKQLAERKKAEEENKKKAEEFLAENKKKEGVFTTESGLQYQILRQGDGPKPQATDRVKVHYVGTLLDGTEFDSSIKRGQPATFPVNRVIKGWTEALQLMPKGSKYKLFIPPELGYGVRGAGSKIGPNSLLIFEVELLDILPSTDAESGAQAALKKAEALTKMKPAGTKTAQKPAAQPAKKPAPAAAQNKPAAQ